MIQLQKDYSLLLGRRELGIERLVLLPSHVVGLGKLLLHFRTLGVDEAHWRRMRHDDKDNVLLLHHHTGVVKARALGPGVRGERRRRHMRLWLVFGPKQARRGFY